MVGYTEGGKKLPQGNHELKMLQAERWGADSIEEGHEKSDRSVQSQMR